MHKFTNAGHDYILSLAAGDVRRVKTDCGLDFSNAADGQAIVTLHDDRMQLASVLWTICAPQAEAAGVSRSDFDSGLNGDSLDAGATALIAAWIDFAPPSKRGAMRQALAKIKRMEARLIEQAEAALNSPELDAQLDAALEGFCKSLYGNARPEAVAAV